MERTLLHKQEGPTLVWITDDPEQINVLSNPGWGSVVQHTVVLKGHSFELFINCPDQERFMNDPEMALEFARDFMTNDSSSLMDWARVLLL